MKARAGLSIVIGFLVLGAFSACQETSKHKSQSTGSSQVSASSGVSSQDSLSGDRKFSTNKATQSNQAQLQQPHSDSSISASKANADSTVLTSSSPDKDLSPKPKAITKKQARDFCHSDWVKQHYSCKKDHICHYTQEQVYDDIDPYQCKVLSLKKGLAVILSIKEIKDKDEGGGIYYYPVIDLVDIENLKILDRYKDTVSRMNVQPFLQAYLKIPTDSISQDFRLFNIVFIETDDAFDTGYWERQLVNIYQYKNNYLRKILWGLELKDHYEFQDKEMENKLPKNVRNNCINEIQEELTNYRFVQGKAGEEPNIYLEKITKDRWIRGYHHNYQSAIFEEDPLCDERKTKKEIKRKKDIKRYQKITFDGKSYVIPKSWKAENPFY